MQFTQLQINRRLIKSTLGAFVLCMTIPSGLAAPAAVAAITPNVTSGKSDRRIYPEPALPALPPAGGKLEDPTFGTQILRVTDEQDGQSNGTYYSTWSSFNANSTRLLVRRNGGQSDAIYEFDPVNFRLGRKYEFPRLPDGGVLITEGATWSTTDADILFGVAWNGARLWAFNTLTRTYKLVKDFGREPGFREGDYLWQMGMSADDDSFSFTHKNREYKSVGYLTWRHSTDRLLVNATSAVEDEVKVDKSGRYLLMPLSAPDAHGKDFYIRDLATGAVTGLTTGAPDFSPGHGDVGNGMTVTWDNDLNRFLGRRLNSPHKFQIVFELPDWSQHVHLSLQAENETWALVEFYSGAEVGAGLFHRELILIRTDGTQQFRRLLHHRSIYRDYWDSPRANLSRDGRFVAFTSNWGGRKRQDLFIARLDPPIPPQNTRPVAAR